jgi:hypothetical protein
MIPTNSNISIDLKLTVEQTVKITGQHQDIPQSDELGKDDVRGGIA